MALYRDAVKCNYLKNYFPKYERATPHRQTSTDGFVPLLLDGLGAIGELDPNVDNRSMEGPYSPIRMLFGGVSAVEPVNHRTSTHTDQKAFHYEQQGWKQCTQSLYRL